MTHPLTVTFYEGPASSDFSSTLMDQMSRSIEKEQLYIGSNQAFSELQNKLADRRLPCRLTGRQQLPDWIAQKSGRDIPEIVDEHARVRMLEKILVDPNEPLEFLSLSQEPQTAARDLGTLIGRLQKSGVSIRDLDEILKKRFSSAASKAKFHDLRVIMEQYLTTLHDQGRLTREDYILSMSRLLKELQLSTGDVFIDVLDDYDSVTKSILTAVILNADSVFVALPKLSVKNGFHLNAHYRRAAVFWNEIIRELKLELGKDVTIRFEKAKQVERPAELDCLSRSLEDPMSPLPDPGPSIRLVQGLDRDDELLLASRAITELVRQGESPSSILVTGSSIGNWHDQLSSILAAEGVDSVYYQGDTLSRSPIYGFYASILQWLEDRNDSQALTGLLQYEGLGLEEQNRKTLLEFLRSQGPEIQSGLDRLKAVAETVPQTRQESREVRDIAVLLDSSEKAFLQLDTITRQFHEELHLAGTVHEFCSAVLNYAEQGPFLKNLEKTYTEIMETDVSLAETLIQQWRSFNRLILSLDRLFGSETVTLQGFRSMIDQFADEVIVSTSGQRQRSVHMEPLHSARTIHCSHLFLLGAGNDEIPVLPNPAFISDQEVEILTAAMIDFRSNSDWADESNSDAVTAIANAEKSVYISWHKRDDDQELEPAEFLRKVAREIGVEDHSDKNIAEDEFLADMIRLQTLVGRPEFAEEAEKLRKQYAFSERYSDLLKKTSDWMNTRFDQINQNAAKEAVAGIDSLSVTSLEAYNKCPFQFFMQRIIKPKDTHEFEETAADRGNFIHEILDECISAIKEKDINLEDETKLEELFNTIAQSMILRHNGRILESGGLMEYEKDELLRNARLAMEIIIEQWRGSGFDPKYLEYKIGGQDGFYIPLPTGERFRLTGTADRIDVWKDSEGNEYARVIDYKTGNRKIKLTSEAVEIGLRLQPPLYLASFAAESGAIPAGMYYDRTARETLPIENHETSADPNENKGRRRSRQLSGITLNEEKILDASDTVYSQIRGEPEPYVSDKIQLSQKVNGKLDSRSCQGLLSQDDIELLLQQAVSRGAQTVTSILDGDVQAVPQSEDGISPCGFCPFRLSCHKHRTAIE